MKKFFLILCFAIPFATFSQVTTKAYKLSETEKEIIVRIEVKNNTKDNIVIVNNPEFVRDEQDTYIYAVNTIKIKQLKQGKTLPSTFSYMFYSGDANTADMTKLRFIHLLAGKTTSIDIVTKKQEYNDNKIHIYGELVYRILENKRWNGGGCIAIDTEIKF